MRELRQKLGVASECGRCSQCALGILRGQQSNATPAPAEHAIAFA
jgi:bacterioferritin-associated ferredoxin